MRGVFKEMYLDTNAWSELAKGNRRSARLDEWLKTNDGFLTMSPHAAVELCRKPPLLSDLLDFMEERKTVLVTHGKDEITGKKIFWASWYDLWYPVDFRDKIPREIFVEEMLKCSLLDAANKVRANRTWLKEWLESSLNDAPPPGKNPWRRFDTLLSRWISARAKDAGHPFVEEGLHDPDCYRGEKLQFGYLFERFYVSRKTWEGPDFLDFLHMYEMAYADAVVTEKKLVHCIREVHQRVEGLGPSDVNDLNWLDG